MAAVALALQYTMRSLQQTCNIVMPVSSSLNKPDY